MIFIRLPGNFERQRGRGQREGVLAERRRAQTAEVVITVLVVIALCEGGVIDGVMIIVLNRATVIF